MAKILMIAPSFFSVGGIQSLMNAVIDHSSHEFDIFVRANEYDSSKVETTNANQITPINFSNGGHHKEMIRLYLNSSWNYDAVYISSLRHVDAAIFPSMIGTEVVCHAHGNDLFICRYSNFINEKFLRMGIKLTSRFIAVSKWTQSKLQSINIDKSRIQVIPNGVDTKRFNCDEDINYRQQLGLPEDEFTLLTVSRLVPRKGHKIVLESLASLNYGIYIIVGMDQKKISYRL